VPREEHSPTSTVVATDDRSVWLCKFGAVLDVILDLNTRRDLRKI
jgi:hypothetical protein